MQLYFVALLLPEDLNLRIQSYKNMMYAQYGCRVGLKSPAHITLIPPFRHDRREEATLLQVIAQLNEGITPFAVRTGGFSSFRPRTIFVALQPSEQLQELKKKTDRFFTAHPGFGAKVDRRPFHPHITIATRDLSKEQYYEAWPFFEQEPFEASWTAERISLLRHNGQKWEAIDTVR